MAYVFHAVRGEWGEKKSGNDYRGPFAEDYSIKKRARVFDGHVRMYPAIRYTDIVSCFSSIRYVSFVPLCLSPTYVSGDKRGSPYLLLYDYDYYYCIQSITIR